MNPEYKGSHRGGSRISGKGVHMYKGVGVHFANLISFGLSETKLFHFHRIFKNRGGGDGGSTPLDLDPPLS